MINFDNFPTFSEEHFQSWTTELTPIEEHSGFLVKRDDYFNLAGVTGGKVRQCSKLVYDNIDHIREQCNGGILTAAGIPSPQSCITSAVARSEEHTSELQSRRNLVCRLLLEKKK